MGEGAPIENLERLEKTGADAREPAEVLIPKKGFHRIGNPDERPGRIAAEAPGTAAADEPVRSLDLRERDTRPRFLSRRAHPTYFWPATLMKVSKITVC
jgi:hypothetical protein